jgi:chromosome segregation ATPase
MAELSNQDLAAEMSAVTAPDSAPPTPTPDAVAQTTATRQVTQLEFDWVYSSLLTAPTTATPTLAIANRKVAIPAIPQNEPDSELDQLDPTEIPSRQQLTEPLNRGNLATSPLTQTAADPFQRIQQLEQALDQCQTYIDELKQQLVEQQFLEEVLAKTEEAAHVQQQAINTLKHQLEQQEFVGAQLTELEATKLALQAALQNSELDAQVARDELAELRQAHQQWQTEQATVQQQFDALQTNLTQKETELIGLQSQLQQTEELTEQRQNQLSLIKARAQQLETDLRERQQNLRDLEARLQRSKEVVTAQQEIIDTLQSPMGSDASKNKLIQSISKTLLGAQNKIESLEAELSGQRISQAKLQHYSQELEENSRDHLKRIDTLEAQTAEMQEQILQQAQQASEYEAAVQHWKDRCLDAEESLVQLKSVVEQMVNERHPSELELATQSSGSDSSYTAESARLLKGLKLDLPGFLHLRRTNSRS